MKVETDMEEERLRARMIDTEGLIINNVVPSLVRWSFSHFGFLILSGVEGT